MKRYDYRCTANHVFEVRHRMTESPTVLCPQCKNPARIIITTAPVLHQRPYNRTWKQPDRPSNAEYQAYKKWEDAGGAADAPEKKEFMRVRGGF